jgi:predicted DNA-binding transcriptional regulator AlpA
MDDRSLATPEDLAEYLNDIPVKTLAEWRSKGTGPRYRKIGRHVRYDWRDIRAWLAQQAVSGSGRTA